MRSMKWLACALSISLVVACGKSEGDDAAAGTGGGSTAGTGSSGTGSSQSDGGSAGTGGGTLDGGHAVADGGGGDVDSAVPPIDAPPAIKELAEGLAEGICVALSDCLGPSALAEAIGGEDCEQRFTAETLSGEFAHLQASVDANRVILDASKIGACVSGIKTMGCGIESDSFPAACDEAVEGQVAVGDPCTINADCVGTAFCKLGAACPSVCADLLGAGDACTEDEECADDLVCAGGQCAEPAADGDACAGNTGKACALGLTCWDADDDPPTAGVCHTTAETLAGGLGDECSPGSVLCEEGLSCTYAASSSTNFACAARVSSGGECQLGLPGQCPVDEYCDAESATAKGTCTAKPVDGEACVLGGTCAPSFVCVPDGKGGGLCRRIQNNGGACAIDDACRSGYCDAAKCEPPPVCDL